LLSTLACQGICEIVWKCVPVCVRSSRVIRGHFGNYTQGKGICPYVHYDSAVVVVVVVVVVVEVVVLVVVVLVVVVIVVVVW